MSIRHSLAVLAIAVVGVAGGAASASPINTPIGPNKLIVKLCKPHFERHSRYLGIKKIGFRYYRAYRLTVVRVDFRCRRHVVSVRYRYLPLPYWRGPGV